MSLKIAVIGSGISGLVSAYLLSKQYEVHLFEANDALGGHTHTVTIPEVHKPLHIDCGFIVFNKKTYPSFTKLLEKEQIAYQMSEMSFSYYSPQKAFYYNGHTLGSLFCDEKNRYSLPFYRMLFDIVQFNQESKKVIRKKIFSELTLRDYLTQKNYSRLFIDTYLVPMISSIWSTPKDKALEMPLQFLLTFYQNHGLLDLFCRPPWYVIQGGSASYIPKLVARCRENVHLSSKVSGLIRKNERIYITVNGAEHVFDKVVIATHANEALKLLSDPTEQEIAILSRFAYQDNQITLHTDSSVLPPHKKGWASWNYYENESGNCTLNYYANRLQNLKTDKDFIVSVNLEDKISSASIVKQLSFSHPILSVEAVRAQKQVALIDGKQNTFFCGAYWGNGFHEDGMQSALRVCNALKAYL